MDAQRARSFPAALEPPQPLASEAVLDENGAEVPVARLDSGRRVLPRAPSDALEGAPVSGKARASPSLPSAGWPPGVSHGVAAHEPTRYVGRELIPSLSRKASKGALPGAASSATRDVAHCGSRESERREDEPPADEVPHVMISPRPECQKRLSGFL